MPDHSQHHNHQTPTATSQDPHAHHRAMAAQKSNTQATTIDHSAHQDNAHAMHHGQTTWHPVLAVILIAFFLYSLWRLLQGPVKKQAKSIDLLAWAPLRALVKWRFFSPAIRTLPAALLLFIIACGLWGRMANNLAAGFTWIFWWTALIFFVAFGGKVFCAICPWDYFANLFQFGFGKFRQRAVRTTKGTRYRWDHFRNFNLKWPPFLSNIYPATMLFVLLTWFELGFDVTRNSFTTAILGLFVLSTAILTALLFKRRSFCRYACPVGRISGLYAQFSPLELRHKDLNVCNDCKTKECVKGTATSTPCPTFLVPYKVTNNTYCTLCTECIRSCDKENLTLRLRPFGQDLNHDSNPPKDEATLTVVMLVLTFFHGLTMTPQWYQVTDMLKANTHLSYQWSFTFLMSAILFGAFLLFYTLIHLQQRWALQRHTHALLFCFIPVTLGYHLGHNAMHLFGEIQYLIPLVNDPFGFSWDIFGFAGYAPKAFVSHQTLTFLQFGFLLLGAGFSFSVLRHRISAMPSTSMALQSGFYVAYSALIATVAGGGLWLILQPMVMKSM